jgi:TolB protein
LKRARRAHVEDPFGVQEDLGLWHRDPFISFDGLSLYTREDDGEGGVDIWYATRTDRASAFGAPVNLTVVNSSSGESGPSVSPDGVALYFSSDRPGGAGGSDTYVSTRECL